MGCSVRDVGRSTTISVSSQWVGSKLPAPIILLTCVHKSFRHASAHQKACGSVQAAVLVGQHCGRSRFWVLFQRSFLSDVVRCVALGCTKHCPPGC